MFPSTTLFTPIDCPLFRWGRCERPYCIYNHGEDKSSGVMKATDLKVSAAYGASHTTEDNTCLEELERINKEIEAVKSEMEKEQKRLSQYQSSQSLAHTEIAGVCYEKYLRTTNSPAKDQNGNHLRSTKPLASSKIDRKYVVDRARPKTDLEYDPCSNFSADLLSGSSVDGKLRSVDKEVVEHGLKNNGTQKICQSLSSHLDDSDDDEGTLVIDIPPTDKYQEKHRPKPKNKTSVIESPVRYCAANNASIVNDQTQLKETRPQKEKLFSEGSGSLQVTNNVDVQDKEEALTKPTTIAQEEESSEGELVINVSPLKDEQKLLNRCGTVTKELLDLHNLFSISEASAADTKETKEGSANKQEKHFVKQITEEPVAELNVSTKCNNLSMEEKAQNMEYVLDDFSTYLDSLRNESESIKSIQDAKLLPVSLVHENAEISLQSVKGLAHNAPFKTEPQSDQNSRCGENTETVSNTKISEDLGSLFQPYLPMVSSHSFSTFFHKGEEHTYGSNSEDIAEATWPTVHKSSKSEPFVHKIPHVSGIQDRIVLSEPLTSPLNPRAIVEYEQKLSALDTSFAPSQETVSSQACASAVMKATNKQVTEIDSSSEEELRYSDLDLSETDPMEECYKIFMEANQTEAHVVQNEAPVVQSDDPEEFLDTLETGIKSNPPPVLKRRVAHVSKYEQATKSKGQIIVPLREAGSQLTIPTRAQACQRRAAILTAAVKGCQSQVVNNAPKKVYTPTIINSSTMQNSIIPVGATLQLGPNLHLIVPQGNSALPLMLIPTPMSVQRLPQPTPSPPTQLPQTTHLQQTIHSQTSQPSNYIPAKSMGVKRKAKVRHEVGAKVPHDVRQRYVNLFVEEFLKSSVTVQDAFEKALAEEKGVYDRSINKLKYLSIAVNALKKLKNQSVLPAKASSERDQHVSRGNVPLNTQALQGPDDWTLYKQLKQHVLSEEMLQVNNYPRVHPDKANFAIQYGDNKKGISDSLKRICCRCGATFSVDRSGKHTRREECNYHYGKVIENKVPGGVETRYSCCESAVGSPGCQVFNLHVYDAVSLQGFVSSLPQSPAGKTCPGVFALDTETCYTTQGLELARVTVVNSRLQVVFDTFVKPDNNVIDYNTRFSGISKEDVEGTSSSLRDVQAVLLSFINADTFLIGHGLENDLAALKIIHSSVIDTSVVFPHRLGLPHKRELNSLTGDYLRRIIQESVEGHDSREDATACMELMLWRVKEDSKVKRW
nr:RNA exonuclease 1 homolog isoform X1 [Misgurnus anguillicaudatus]